MIIATKLKYKRGQGTTDRWVGLTHSGESVVFLKKILIELSSVLSSAGLVGLTPPPGPGTDPNWQGYDSSPRLAKKFAERGGGHL